MDIIERKNFVTELIEQIESGNAFWQKPWNVKSFLPCNGISGKVYKGMNFLRLLLSNTNDARWFTEKMCNRLKLEWPQNAPKEYVDYYYAYKFKNPDSLNENTKFACRSYVVVNGEYISKLKPITIISNKDIIKEKNENLDNIIKKHGINIVSSSEAFYKISTKNTIYIPNIEYFNSIEEYYSTLYHEVAHLIFNEHTKIKDSKQFKKITNNDYINARALEELIVEISSALICIKYKSPKPNNIYIQLRNDNHMRYINSWLKTFNKNTIEKVLKYAINIGFTISNVIDTVDKNIDKN